jgi:glucose-6-phosphate 1-dehydrogenase
MADRTAAGGVAGQAVTPGGRGRGVEPSIFVVFGGTGDLAQRKILPALYKLHAMGRTAAGCVVVGVSRDADTTDESFRRMACEAVAESGVARAEAEAWAARWLFFQSTGAGTEAEFVALRDRITGLEREFALPQNRSFYLSLPPAAVAPTATMLGTVGLNRSEGWTRLVVEKPFGRNLESARALNALLHEWFDESQIYRIDHYLGKETVQNLLVFRFANDLFETMWSRDHIESVQITVAESLGVEQRAGYYDKAGALRDMIQSHLTQLVALIAMEVPVAIEAGAIRAEKIKALKSITPIHAEDVVLGQYAAGEIGGKRVPGYREEPGVAPDSQTETFAALRLRLENWRWAGVPFYLRTGKRLPRRLTEIVITFRRAPVWMFRTVQTERPHRNALVLTLQPDEGFCLYFDVKKPGELFKIEQLPLHFTYAEAFDALPEAYQTLILDLLRGDPTLFVHGDEVETSWALYTPILGRREPVYPYPAGSWGPGEAEWLKAR